MFVVIKHRFILDVRWLSAGRATARLFDLSFEVSQVIFDRATEADLKTAKEMLRYVEEDDFWLSIAYMSDVFSSLNQTCLAMQGDDITIFDVSHLMFFILIFFKLYTSTVTIAALIFSSTLSCLSSVCLIFD